MVLQHGDITHKIIGCAIEVQRELGCGFLESVYEKALTLMLRKQGLIAINQYPIRVRFRGEDVGSFVGDILVEDKVLVELKVVKALAPEHHAQVINYLHATGVGVGLLINFGNSTLEFRRFYGRSTPEVLAVPLVHPC